MLFIDLMNLENIEQTSLNICWLKYMYFWMDTRLGKLKIKIPYIKDSEICTFVYLLSRCIIKFTMVLWNNPHSNQIDNGILRILINHNKYWIYKVYSIAAEILNFKFHNKSPQGFIHYFRLGTEKILYHVQWDYANWSN